METDVETFDFDGKTFEIHYELDDDRFTVYVTLNEERVSPNYVVEVTVHRDHFKDQRGNLVKHLRDIAESDIREGMYFKG